MHLKASSHLLCCVHALIGQVMIACRRGPVENKLSCLEARPLRATPCPRPPVSHHESRDPERSLEVNLDLVAP
ncbi:unnamed protein product [Merluccius merluccius]